MGFDPATILGLPFKSKGRDPAMGVDCYYPILEFYRQEGRPIADPLGACEETEEAVTTQLPETWETVRSGFKRGDVLVFRSTDGAEVLHVGVYLGDHQVIHATRNAGVICSPLRHMKGRLLRGYRLCRE